MRKMITMNRKQEFLKKLKDLKFEMVNKQCELDDLMHKAVYRNQDELWCKLDLLIEEYSDI